MTKAKDKVMNDLLTSEERAAHDEAVAATGFRRDYRNGGWIVVGPAGTERATYTVRSGEVTTVWIVNSRRFFVNDEGVQMFAATVEEAA